MSPIRNVLYQTREPCSDLGGFMRLLSTPGGMADGLVRETIPQGDIMSPFALVNIRSASLVPTWVVSRGSSLLPAVWPTAWCARQYHRRI